MGDYNRKKIGVVGATGAVGMEMLKVLAARNFPVAEMHLFASTRSAGKQISTPFGDLTVKLFTVEDVRKMDIVFLAVSGSFAKKYAKEIAAPGGAIVIDNSSAFRLDPDIPLIVPEINGLDIKDSKLIANPNCTTAIAAMALWPIHCKYGLKKVIVSTYQAASGAGAEGMEELRRGTADALSGKDHENEVFVHPLPFNVIPHIDTFQQNYYTREEMKVTWETRKIFHEDELNVSCTAVRVPTLRAHAESITLETILPVSANEVRQLLQNSPGVSVVDHPSENKYPMPNNASEKNDVQVGRIRENSVFGNHGLDIFVCGDQLLRGAALNAVLIAEYIFSPSKSVIPTFISPKTSLNLKVNELERSFCIGMGVGFMGSMLITGLLSFILMKKHHS